MPDGGALLIEPKARGRRPHTAEQRGRRGGGRGSDQPAALGGDAAAAIDGEPVGKRPRRRAWAMTPAAAPPDGSPVASLLAELTGIGRAAKTGGCAAAKRGPQARRVRSRAAAIVTRPPPPPPPPSLDQLQGRAGEEGDDAPLSELRGAAGSRRRGIPLSEPSPPPLDDSIVPVQESERGQERAEGGEEGKGCLEVDTLPLPQGSTSPEATAKEMLEARHPTDSEDATSLAQRSSPASTWPITASVGLDTVTAPFAEDLSTTPMQAAGAGEKSADVASIAAADALATASRIGLPSQGGEGGR